MKLVIIDSGRLGSLLENGSVVDLNSAYTALLRSRGVPDSEEIGTLRVSVVAKE